MKHLARRFAAVFDSRSALIGAALMGSIVALINARHGLAPALVAASKQAAYTLIIAGLVLRLCERLAIAYADRGWGTLLATLAPTIVTISATTILHHLRGTPEPWASVIPTALLGPPSFVMWARRARRLHAAARPQPARPREPDPRSADAGESP
ncbi:MAG: hypothetical protein KC468_18130 [Myxococcales bacterium]|nr:hypothetical protein [Myxococcales bacterium]